MASLNLLRESKEDGTWPDPFLEVRVFGLTGRPDQEFAIGSGCNFQANHNYCIEFLYGVKNVPLIHVRDFLHYYRDDPVASRREDLDRFLKGESEEFIIGDMLPASYISVKSENHTYEGNTYTNYTLEIALDVGAVYEHKSPEVHFAKFCETDIDNREQIEKFLRDLLDEFDLADAGMRPDPADLHYHEWAFANQLNRRAYDNASDGYQEVYFDNKNIRNMFAAWQSQIRPGGHVLDIGCGHGNPVIARLLECGHTVTGIDLSPKMLAKARAAYPGVTLMNQTINQLEDESTYDAACSFNSMLYLDPIDFYHAIYTLHRALKPGGKVLLFGYDSSPTMRGVPLNELGNQTIWHWKYGMDEAAAALEEHGRFKVLQTANTTASREQRAFLARLVKRKKERDASAARARKNNPPNEETFKLPMFANIEPSLEKQMAYSYAIIAEKIS